MYNITLNYITLPDISDLFLFFLILKFLLFSFVCFTLRTDPLRNSSWNDTKHLVTKRKVLITGETKGRLSKKEGWTFYEFLWKPSDEITRIFSIRISTCMMNELAHIVYHGTEHLVLCLVVTNSKWTRSFTIKVPDTWNLRIILHKKNS